MKLTKLQLKQIIKEELETEGLFGPSKEEHASLNNYVEGLKINIENLIKDFLRTGDPCTNYGTPTQAVLNQILEMVKADPGKVRPRIR